MPIEGLGLQPGGSTAPDGKGRTDKVDDSARGSSNRSARGADDQDSLQISDAGRLAAQDQTDPANAPNRPDKVAEARKIWEGGLYNDQGVLEQTAEQLLPLFKA